jgi:hypothetical protein
MAGNDQKELGPEDFDRLAAELDSKGFVELPEEGPSAKSGGQESTESPSHDDAEVEDKPRDSSEGEQSPEEEQVPERKSETKEESEYSKAQKDRDRLDRNWEKQQQLADQVRREREQLEREKADWQKQRESGKQPASDKDEKGYSAEDYDRATEEFLLDGNREMAEEAKNRARTLRTQTHQRLWMEHLETVKKENPGIEKSDHPLHEASLRVLRDIPVLNAVPDGVRHAVRIAKAEKSASLISDLQTENQKLKSEIKRLNESMEVGGSGPMRIPSEKAFEEMNPKEQEKMLSRMAEEADRMGLA